MKYNSTFKTVFILFLASSLFLISGCEKKTIHPYNFDTESFHQYEEAVQQRSFDKLYQLLDDENPDVRRLAWLAISKTSDAEIDKVFERITASNKDYKWFTLSRLPISENLMNDLEKMWENKSANRELACIVFANLGDSQQLNTLLKHQDYVIESEQCALAIGKITSRRHVPSNIDSTIIRLTFKTDDQVVRRNLLYGYYRNRVNNIRTQTDNSDLLINLWREHGLGKDKYLDKMIVKIVGEPAMELVALVFMRGGYEDYNPILNELIRNMAELEIDYPGDEFVKKIFRQQNHHTSILLLNLLKKQNNVSSEIVDFVKTEIAGPTRDPLIFLNALEVLLIYNRDLSHFSKKLEFIDQHRPDLFNIILRIYNEILSEVEYLELVFHRAEGNKMDSLLAIRTLARIVRDNGEFLSEQKKDRIHKLIRGKIENNDSFFAGSLEFLLADENLYTDNHVLELYEIFRDEDVSYWREFYELFAKVIYRRFGNDAKTLLTEIAKKGDNRILHLLRHIDIETTYSPEEKFKKVDWQKLTEAGAKPHWILKTTKGSIEVALDPLTAPFTVSAIIQLTESGLYNDVPFHRVVADFVVQGGDYIFNNGEGAPKHFLPTEPSTASFESGAVGMASQGTDTEGSQYFFTKSWSPHLDGNYTIFGQVVRGMDVIESIRFGDNVQNARISPR